jgi:hypothetical protein
MHGNALHYIHYTPPPIQSNPIQSNTALAMRTGKARSRKADQSPPPARLQKIKVDNRQPQLQINRHRQFVRLGQGTGREVWEKKGMCPGRGPPACLIQWGVSAEETHPTRHARHAPDGHATQLFRGKAYVRCDIDIGQVKSIKREGPHDANV